MTVIETTDRLRRPRILREIGCAVLAALIAVALAVVALRVSFTDLTERWSIGGTPDGVMHNLLFVNSTENFSFATNPGLGFPDGLNAFFVAQIDVQAALAMSVLAAIVHNGIMAHNVFVLLTFASTALGGYLFFRALRIRRWLSVLFAVIFSLAPYHFIRVGYGHTFIENYWVVPLAGVLLLIAAGPRTNPFADWAAHGLTPRRRAVRVALPPIILSLLIATSVAYYFAFAVLIVGGVWLFTVLGSLLARTPWRAIAVTAIGPGSLVVFVAINLAISSGGYGVRYASYSAARPVADSEIYAGKLMSMILPWSGSGLPGARGLANKYSSVSNLLPNTEAPGTPVLAILGMVALALAVVVFVLVGNRTLPDSWMARIVTDARTRVLGTAMVWAFLFFIVSGLGVAVALFGSTQIRAWVRVSIFLVMFGLAFLALLVNALPSRFGARVVVAVLLAVIAIFDQIVGVAGAVQLTPTADEETKAYVAAADAALPDGCGVVQLPIAGFPESGPTGKMPEHEQALPFLYTQPGHLRWSYGSVDGTVGRKIWLDATTPEAFAAAVTQTGACAVSVNLDGYSDNPDAWKPLVTAAGGDPNAPIVTSPSRGVLLFTVGAEHGSGNG